MDWNDISQPARDTMQTLGGFGPTVLPENREIKGYPQEDGKTYYDADELRKMATHFVEVADWLDARAKSALANDLLSDAAKGPSTLCDERPHSL
jgi:aminoglycoside/choline kinase family phosphotransferase